MNLDFFWGGKSYRILVLVKFMEFVFFVEK